MDITAIRCLQRVSEMIPFARVLAWKRSGYAVAVQAFAVTRVDLESLRILADHPIVSQPEAFHQKSPRVLGHAGQMIVGLWLG